MGLILSIDLAYKKIENFGVCLIEMEDGQPTKARFLPPEELGLVPLDSQKCAKAIFSYCRQRDVHIVFLDGPQGWKDPQSKLWLRQAEAETGAPFRVGRAGEVLPKTTLPFVQYCIGLFAALEAEGALRVTEHIIQPPIDSLLAVESFPTSAWKRLGLKPLPAKGKATPKNMGEGLHRLKKLFGFTTAGKVTHDNLQALVSGLAGVAILNGDSSGYVSEGAPPRLDGGVTVEGFIVNPRIEPDQSPALPDEAIPKRMLYYLKLTRESEWRIENVLYRQGKIVGGVYVGRGQEAIGVGAALAMRPGDVTFPSHRDFSVFVIRGFSLADIFANWLGRADSPNRGRDNTLHIGDLKLGIIPIISPLGATLPVACGAAMVLKQRGEGNVVLVHFGEGTTSLGHVHEAMNFAAVRKLPVIFICNNNQFAYSTPVEKQFAVKSLAVRGPAYGMPGESVDGTDVMAVYDAVDRASARARAGKGPSFLECVTLRMAGHSAHDAAEYVPEKLKLVWAKKDPIQRLEKLLLSRKIMTKQQIEELGKQVSHEIDRAIAEAEARPLPRGEEAIEGVYCEPDCWWRKPPSVVSGPLSVVPQPPVETVSEVKLATDNGPRTTDE